MNSELEKLIEKYRITVNGLADLESGYDGTAAAAEKVIKERGFVTLNGLLVESDASHNTDGAPAANTEENTSVSPAPSDNSEEHSPSGEPATESDASHNEPTPVVPAPSDNSAENTPVAPAVPAAPAPSEPAIEQPGVTPVVEGPVSGDTNLGNEVAGGERADEHNPSGEEETSEDDTASTEDSTTGRKPKKKKN